MTGRLQFWLQRREWWPACWLGNRISDVRYWLWRVFDGSWPKSVCLCDRFKGNVSFDRTICACGSMHYYCDDCGWQTDPCDTITIDTRYPNAVSNTESSP